MNDGMEIPVFSLKLAMTEIAPPCTGRVNISSRSAWTRTWINSMNNFTNRLGYLAQCSAVTTPGRNKFPAMRSLPSSHDSKDLPQNAPNENMIAPKCLATAGCSLHDNGKVQSNKTYNTLLHQLELVSDSKPVCYAIIPDTSASSDSTTPSRSFAPSYRPDRPRCLSSTRPGQ